jgi:hypothetical protein
MSICFCRGPASFGRRNFLGTVVAAASLPVLVRPGKAQTPPASAGPANAALLDDLVDRPWELWKQRAMGKA